MTDEKKSENDDRLHIEGDELVRDRWLWGSDAAGEEIPPDSVRKAVKAWNDLWSTALFDCGPQDYDFMVKEIKARFGVIEEQKGKQLKFLAVKCPHCGEITGIGGASLFETISMSRKKCEQCGEEFLIVNDVPMTEEEYEKKSKQKFQ